jgi:hypothetical protein
MISRIAFVATFLLFGTSAILFGVGVLTRSEYRIGWGYFVILDGGVYLHRRGSGRVFDIPFFVMLGLIVIAAVASLLLWKIWRRKSQRGRGFEIGISN